MSTAANSPYVINQDVADYNPSNDDYNNFKEYYLYSDRCCKIGYYWNSTKCETIPLSNCVKLGTSVTDCIECKPNYKFVTNACV